MSLLFCDSFNHYATADIGAKYNTTYHGTITSGGRTGNCLTEANTNDSFSYRGGLGQKTTLILGFAFKTPTAWPASDLQIAGFKDVITTQVDIRLTSNGKLRVTKGGSSLSLGTTQLSLSIWYYIELKVTFHGSAGVYELHINGATEFSGSSANTSASGNAYADGFFLGNNDTPNVAIFKIYDDVYICDNSGSLNNTFLGDVTVQAVYPNEAGTTQNWTSTGANHWSVIDEVTPSEVDYLSENDVDGIDTNGFTDITLTGTIKGAQLCSYLKKDDAGGRTVAHVCRSNGANYVSSQNNYLGNTSLYYLDIYETDPGQAPAAAWILENLNLAEFGAKLIA